MDSGHHCPFLNRTDARCSAFFSLDRLGHAFTHCFGQYGSCPVYGEMLAERRERRMNASACRSGADVAKPLVQVTLPGKPVTLHGRAEVVAADRHHLHAA